MSALLKCKGIEWFYSMCPHSLHGQLRKPLSSTYCMRGTTHSTSTTTRPQDKQISEYITFNLSSVSRSSKQHPQSIQITRVLLDKQWAILQRYSNSQSHTAHLLLVTGICFGFTCMATSRHILSPRVKYSFIFAHNDTYI